MNDNQRARLIRAVDRIFDGIDSQLEELATLKKHLDSHYNQNKRLLAFKYLIEHEWNDRQYFIEYSLAADLSSRSKKWFVGSPSGYLVCKKSSDKFGFYVENPEFNIGFDSPSEALAAFDEIMAVRYTPEIDSL